MSCYTCAHAMAAGVSVRLWTVEKLVERTSHQLRLLCKGNELTTKERTDWAAWWVLIWMFRLAGLGGIFGGIDYYFRARSQFPVTGAHPEIQAVLLNAIMYGGLAVSIASVWVLWKALRLRPPSKSN